MIILICKMFKKKVDGKYTNEEELLVDYAIELESGRSICVPCEHPSKLGGKFYSQLGEWVLED